jgi:hypothetical protein
MPAPALKLTVTQRQRLGELALEQRKVVPAGRVMLEKRRRVVGCCNLDDLVNKSITERADTLCLSAADFNDVKEWLR